MSKAKYSYDYDRPAIAVDTVVFGYQNGELFLLLIERGVEPFLGQWALPGGFVRMSETLEQAALRELQEETGVKDVYLDQLYTFGDLDRDPRERVISVAYFALVKPSRYHLNATTDAAKAKWFSISELPKLAFDHKKILKTARERLQSKLLYEPLGFELLPPRFTLTELQKLYEAVLDRKLDKRNFRKKVLSFGILKELDKKIENVPYRAPSLYKFDVHEYKKNLKSGTQFEL